MATDDYQYECDVRTLAACLGCTDRTIQRLAQAGTVIRLGDNSYDLAASVQRYIEKIEQQADDSADLRKARQRSLDLDNQRKQLENDRAAGLVYDRATIDRDFTAYAAEIVKLHGSFTTALKKRNPKVAERVWTEIDERLATIRAAAKQIRISPDAISHD